MDVGKGKQN